MKKSIVIVFLTVTLAAFCTPLWADDVLDSINEAIEAYKEGQYSEAAESLDYASQLIKQKKGESLEEILPKPLAGWQAEPTSSQAAGMAMFGGSVSAQRGYRKAGASIKIQVITDSPMMQGMMMMFTNPMLASADGGKMEKIKRQKAIVKYDSGAKKGSITLMVANRYMVMVEGSKVSRDDLKAYAAAIDYNKLKAMP